MDNIILNNKQEEALKLAVARYNLGMPYTVISGYAGSGKSTLIKFIIAALNLPPEEIAFVAYTGKAANVLKNKGCPNATTAHKLLYYAKRTKEGFFVFEPKERLDADYKLIVVDEVSMLPESMWNQLLSHHVYVLACGDPGQLSPPRDTAAPILQKPHVFLDEIMRQAQESAIIRLSMHIREGKDFRLFPTVSGEVRIIPSKHMFYDEDVTLLQASQIICGTNEERNRINTRVRQLMGKGELPEIGDKIIGLDNHWDCFSKQGNALTNGAIGTIKDFELKEQRYPNQTDTRFKIFPDSTTLMYTDFDTDDGDIFPKCIMPIDYKCIITGNPSLTPKQEAGLANYQKNLLAQAKRKDYFPLDRYWKELPYHFNYAYAITCWKAQGSEFPYILGYDCHWLKNKNRDEYIKYLYTLVTRSSQAVILVGD